MLSGVLPHEMQSMNLLRKWFKEHWNFRQTSITHQFLVPLEIAYLDSNAFSGLFPWKAFAKLLLLRTCEI